MTEARDFGLIVTSGVMDSDGRPVGMWTIDYPSGQRAAEIFFRRDWITSNQLWYEDGTPAACYSTDGTGEFNGPCVRWHANGRTWEQATFGDNEEFIGMHLVFYDNGVCRARGNHSDETERYEYWHSNGQAAATEVDGVLENCMSATGEAMAPEQFLEAYGGVVVDVMPDVDGSTGVHIQGPTENARILDDMVSQALSDEWAKRRSEPIR